QDLAGLPGFRLAFNTVSEKGEKVSQSLNLLFVTHTETGHILEGDYLRDRAYEEARPIISHFRFDTQTNELLMTTNYTRVVSVDSITLVNPDLRIRKILNYSRPPAEQPLSDVVLVGFGVEQKVA
ncbi:MAG: phycobiliprotein lyase, partial [Cyanobacteria bacterium J06639_1]